MEVSKERESTRAAIDDSPSFCAPELYFHIYIFYKGLFVSIVSHTLDSLISTNLSFTLCILPSLDVLCIRRGHTEFSKAEVHCRVLITQIVFEVVYYFVASYIIQSLSSHHFPISVPSPFLPHVD